MQDCLFCRIAGGELPSQVVLEDEKVVVIMDINPWTKGHCLVLSREHAATIFELSEESAVAVMKAAHRVAPALKEAVQAEGMNLLQSNGRAAWQQVDHVHLHLIPRWFSDPLVPPIVPGPGDPKAIAETAGRIRSLLG